MTRLRHWISWVMAGFAVVALLAGAMAFWFEPRSLTVKRLEVETPLWPEQTAPVTVALISDVHVDGVHMTPQRVRKVVESVNALKPDLILLAGDYVGGDFLKTGEMHGVRTGRTDPSNAQQEDGIVALGALSAPLGVFAVMGNHDCWWDCDRVRALFATTRIRLLENEAAQVKRPGGDLWIAGVEDGMTQSPDFTKTTRKIPARAAVIALEHNPGLFDWPSNNLPVMMAGHTHAGQVRFPFIGAPVRVSRHTEDTAVDGYEIIGKRTLIVTRGLGESGLPVRFGAPPQIMLIRLRPGPVAKVTG